MTTLRRYDSRRDGRRLLIVGLDCVPPVLAFDRFRNEMPVFSELLSRASYGGMRSTAPPITIPAWASMCSGKDPGELGLYGFRNRVRGSYDLRLATRRDLSAKRFWDLAGEAGKRVVALFVPPSTPASPVRGTLVSCFMHDGAGPFTFPAALGPALTERFGPYLADVPDFRTASREASIERLYQMGRQHFAMARHLWMEEQPDVMMMVEIGPDRLHHMLWRCFDEADPSFSPNNPWRSAGRDYYRFLDQELGKLLEVVSKDTVVMVVSDHGARPMEGGVRVNQLLEQAGLLCLQKQLSDNAPFESSAVNWRKTKAYAAGGYYGRVFVNLEGREPEGCVPFRAMDRLLADIENVFASQKRPDGTPIQVMAAEPRSLYRQVRGFPPDLFLFFDDLAMRALGSFSAGPAITRGNDRGDDGCNHDWDGIFLLAGDGLPRGPVDGVTVVDVFQSALSILGLPRPHDTQGVDRTGARDNGLP